MASNDTEKSVLYLIRAACPNCKTVVGFVEERGAPVPLMEEVGLSAEFCPHCSFHVAGEGVEWDVHEDSIVERVDPTQNRYVDTGNDQEDCLQ